MRGRPIGTGTTAALLAAAVLLAGCSGTDGTAPAAANSPSASASAEPATPTPTPTPARRKLKPGAKGPDVKELQRRLKALNYDPGKVDGKYGPSTEMAVWAFQAVNRMKRKSTLGKSFWEALADPEEPRPWGGSTTRSTSTAASPSTAR